MERLLKATLRVDRPPDADISIRYPFGGRHVRRPQTYDPRTTRLVITLNGEVEDLRPLVDLIADQYLIDPPVMIDAVGVSAPYVLRVLEAVRVVFPADDLTIVTTQVTDLEELGEISGDKIAILLRGDPPDVFSVNSSSMRSLSIDYVKILEIIGGDGHILRELTLPRLDSLIIDDDVLVDISHLNISYPVWVNIFPRQARRWTGLRSLEIGMYGIPVATITPPPQVKRLTLQSVGDTIVVDAPRLRELEVHVGYHDAAVFLSKTTRPDYIAIQASRSRASNYKVIFNGGVTDTYTVVSAQTSYTISGRSYRVDSPMMLVRRQ